MVVKLLTELHLEFLSLKGGCRGSSESTLVKCQIVGNLMPRLFIILITCKRIIVCNKHSLENICIGTDLLDGRKRRCNTDISDIVLYITPIMITISTNGVRNLFSVLSMSCRMHLSE